MSSTQDDFITTAPANNATSLALANTVFASVESLTALNLNIARTVFEDALASSKILFGAKTLLDFVGLQIDMAQPAFEKAVGYSGSIYEIASQCGEEASRHIKSQLSEMSKHAISVFEESGKQGPAGWDAGWDAVYAAFKSAIDATKPDNASLDKTSKEVDAGANGTSVAKSVGAPKSRKAA